jgi:hypothetical protein
MKLKELFRENNLLEMSIAREGDWKQDIEYLANISEFVINHKYELLTDKFKVGATTYSLYRLKNTNHFKIGEFYEESENKFRVVLESTLSDETIHNLVIKNLKNVNEIQVISSLQGRGIAKQFYRYLVKHMKFSLMGDIEQFFGARRLWASLNKDIDIVVDIVDIKKGIYIEQNVILHHGSYDADFDTRIWSYANDKAHLRLILTDIR